jgi:hypothetical protein
LLIKGCPYVAHRVSFISVTGNYKTFKKDPEIFPTNLLIMLCAAPGAIEPIYCTYQTITTLGFFSREISESTTGI